jgi:deoxyadenosine/deoxycytidine kinase
LTTEHRDIFPQKRLKEVLASGKKMNTRIISIDGNIGAGKSTILNELEGRGYTVFKEEVNEGGWLHFLNKFYEKPPRWSLTLQLAILENMVSQHEKMVRMKGTKDGVVFIERSPVSSMVFTRNSLNLNHLTREEFDLFNRFHARIAWTPDTTIFVQVEVEECFRRMNARGRDCEAGVEIGYLWRLNELYKNLTGMVGVDGGKGVVEIADEIIERWCRSG